MYCIMKQKTIPKKGTLLELRMIICQELTNGFYAKT